MKHDPERGKTAPWRGGVELMIVPRAQLTVTERAMHIRRLRKTRKLSKQPMAFSEADALEAETIDLILHGNRLLTARLAERLERAP